jgi:hypothetical protein
MSERKTALSSIDCAPVNVFFAAVAAAILPRFFCRDGSIPEASNLRAASLLSRATARETSGLIPRLSMFCLPPNGYRSRHNLLPLLLIKRCKPPPSVRRYGVARAFAFSTTSALSGMSIRR